MSASRAPSVAPAAVTVAVLVALVMADSGDKFEWLLSRALGLSLCWLGYAGFRRARHGKYWNEFFTYAVLGEAVFVVINRSLLRYLPPLWPLMALAGPVLTLLYAGGVRELTKGYRLSEKRSAAVCLGAGLVLHYVVAEGLVDAIFVMLTGRYPGPERLLG